jgi:hypothetical protein
MSTVMEMRTKRIELDQKWTKAFGSQVTKHIQYKLIQLALSWHEQMQANNHWKGSIGAARLSRCLKQTTPLITLSPGTRLMREWQGKVHQVTVLVKGFEHQGKTYSSLSAIAREITGTAWSGPLFFGLKP